MIVKTRMKRAENVAHREEKRKACWVLVRKLDGRKHFEDQGVERNIRSGYQVGKA
jgi:hypothetical protein